MTAPFAAVEARLNDAVVRRLANATAVVDGVSVSCIFDQPPTDLVTGGIYAASGLPLATMASGQPQITARVSDLPAVLIGKSCVIGSVAYKVVAERPTGTGMTTLTLERA